MAIGKIKASRVNTVDATTYVGEEGILFYNFANGVIRLSDGITSGGVPVPYTIASNTVVGGIKAGPGVVISNTGELFIDSANLAVSFGNFTANNNVLSIVNVDENMYLKSSGNANINLVGGVNFYKSNGFPPSTEPFFRAKSDGQLRILVPVEDPLEGGIEIIGSATGTYLTPGQPGAMLQLTGNPNVSARFYMDSIGEYASLVGRRYNGNVASPTQVLAGQDVLRFNATAATNAGMGNVAMAQMQFRALENQTTTAQGSSINFIVTPVGSPVASRVEVANINVANGVSATKFTTSGNITAGNIAASNITTTNVTINSNITVGNINASGAYSGYYTHIVREAGVIADGGTISINFLTDDIVKCLWGNGLTVNYSNFIPGRSIRLMATKTTGTGVDPLNLGNISANQTSTGSAAISGSSDVTYIIEFFSTSSTVAGLYAKL